MILVNLDVSSTQLSTTCINLFICIYIYNLSKISYNWFIYLHFQIQTNLYPLIRVCLHTICFHFKANKARLIMSNIASRNRFFERNEMVLLDGILVRNTRQYLFSTLDIRLQAVRRHLFRLSNGIDIWIFVYWLRVFVASLGVLRGFLCNDRKNYIKAIGANVI